jgi:hypothetical protein
MTCTRDEFMAWLPGATRNAPAHVDGTTLILSVGSGAVEMTLEESEPRRAGQLCLPTLEIRMRFVGIDKAARESFMAYFDLYTRRGGG